MNPLTNVKNIQKLNERELELGVIGKKSWHDEYKDSAWIFIGGLPYDLSEGDIICVFSQYGEVVNMNLVRDHKTGKSKGFAFLCYEDQRSTVLAVDNLNSIKILSRVIRVDHVKDYKVPKDHKEDDELILNMRNEGCAPKIQPDEEAPEQMDIKAEEKLTKKRKKEKKVKKKKKKSEKKRKSSSSSSSSSGTSDDENGSSDGDANARPAKIKKEIKQEVYDRDYDRAAEPSTSSRNGFNARGKQTWSRDRVNTKEERKSTSDYREKEKHQERSESGWGRSARERDDVSKKDGRSQENADDRGGREYESERRRYDERGREGDRNKNRDRFQGRKQDLVRESDRFREADRFRDYDRDRYRDHGKDRERERYADNSRDRERDNSGHHDRYREDKRRRDRSRER